MIFQIYTDDAILSLNKALLWRSEQRSQKQIQNEIHKFVFMNNYYFALDFSTKTIFKEDSKYNGIEFFN